MSRVMVVGALVVLAPLGSGCDPGYTYRPVGPNGQRLPQWTTTIEGVRFSARPSSTLVGSAGSLVDLDIANESDKVVVVLGGQLVTNGRAIEAIIYDDRPNREARTVPAGQSKSVLLHWRFGGSASDVLGTDITWVWRLRIGKAEHALRVPMQRKQR